MGFAVRSAAFSVCFCYLTGTGGGGFHSTGNCKQPIIIMQIQLNGGFIVPLDGKRTRGALRTNMQPALELNYTVREIFLFPPKNQPPGCDDEYIKVFV
jgi:hypothetical protein